MSEFDPERAAFWLIAFVIIAHIAVVFFSSAMCVVFADAIIAGKATCSADGKMSDILGAAMAAALAFSGRSKLK